MNIITKAAKTLGNMIFPGEFTSTMILPQTKFDYSRKVNGYQSAIIMACVGWIQRTYPEAPIFLRKRNPDGTWASEYNHPMLELLDSPNPAYDGQLLQQTTVADYNIDGNSYWRKIRSAGNRVVQLWWLPSWMVTPRWPSHLNTQQTTFVEYYEYSPGGITPEKILPEDIVHFRNGLDPYNMRKGLSPLKSLFREMFTDDEAANMTASLLKNMGVPGVVISPSSEDTKMAKGTSESIKSWFKEMFTGDRRGEPLVMGGPTTVTPFGFNPQQMDLKNLRRIPEERISGTLGVPAIVAGLGAGLDRSTYSNMAEAREMAYENNIIPTQRIVGSVIRRQLLIDFMDDISGYQVAYDLSEVRILQEDKEKKALRIGQAVQDGFCTVADAQRETGLTVDETQHVYLRPLMSQEIPAGRKSGSKSLSIKSANLDTEEKKTIHWKRIDSRRVAWWSAVSKKVSPLYEAEGKAVLGAVSGKPLDDMNKAAEKAIQGLRKDWEKTIKEVDQLIVEDFGKEIADDFGGKSFGDIEYKWTFDPFSAAVRAWITKHAAESVTSILATNLDDVKAIIANGIENGVTNRQIAKELRQFYDDNSAYKAMRIARTETSHAAGFGQREAALQSGVVTKKLWISSRDDRVRDEHVVLDDGVAIPLNEPFANGEMYVGENSINCRCAEGHLTE